MMKTICCLGSAALGVALLSACGSTNTVALDRSKLSTGDGNSVATGGYIWTYTDHNKTPKDAPVADDPTTWDYHATIEPLTDTNTPFKITAEGGDHGNVLKIKGQVPVEIPWTLVAPQDPVSVDKFWPTLYPDAMVPAYPAAGIGFGFQDKNAVYDATEKGKYVGIAFDMKVDARSEVVWVSFPTADTDVPDEPDAFPLECTYYTDENDPQNGGSSCFTNYRKGIFPSDSATGKAPDSYNTMADVGTWKRYCVLFTEVGVPNWANDKTKLMMADLPFDPTRILKTQWDMYQPKGGDPAKFDVSIDNVNLITETQAGDEANNCNMGAIGKAYGSAPNDMS
jgi:hypothetical protein